MQLLTTVPSLFRFPQFSPDGCPFLVPGSHPGRHIDFTASSLGSSWLWPFLRLSFDDVDSPEGYSSGILQDATQLDLLVDVFLMIRLEL